MKLSMWIVNDWLDEYSHEPRISWGKQMISGVRYLADDLELSDNYLYIGENDTASECGKNNIICVNHTDVIVLTAPDIYTIFNEIQQMIEFYNSWETKVLQAISREAPLKTILSDTLPVFKTGIAFTDISHKVIEEAHYENVQEHELINGFLPIDELRLINEQLREHVNHHSPYAIDSFHTKDIIRNFYSRNGELIGWFVSMGGGDKPHLQSRLQLTEVFCNLMDLWFKIHVGELFSSNLFLDILTEKETDRDNISMRLAGIGWSEEPEMQLLILEPCSEDQLGASFIQRYLESSFSGLSCFPYRKNYVVVVNYKLIRKAEFFDYLHKILKSQDSRCGTSFPISDLLQLPNYYKQALCALEFGAKEAGAVNHCEDYVLAYLRDRFCHVMDIDVISPVLRQLKTHDAENGTEYYDTLRMYLLCERDQTLAAKALCIHRNSLVYRVNRLKEMIDADLEDPNTRLYLLLSYFAEE